MRRLNPRIVLSAQTLALLATETQTVTQSNDPKAFADARWKNVRQVVWFSNGVIARLKQMSGAGEPCMWCDCNTSTDVEHYRPKAVFPEFTFTWENYLWACTECNRFKGNRFPPDTEQGARILNPLDDNVWEHFYVDQFGNLNPVWDNNLNQLDARAVMTNEVVRIDRETLQTRRQIRLREILQLITDSLHRFDAGELTLAQLGDRVDALLEAPFQPDVAEYFLKGPGRGVAPFDRVSALLEPHAVD